MPNTRGDILHEVLEARVMPDLVGPVGRGNLQYTAMWKTAQRLTNKPVKLFVVRVKPKDKPLAKDVPPPE